jgi:hypothetical protein
MREIKRSESKLEVSVLSAYSQVNYALFDATNSGRRGREAVLRGNLGSIGRDNQNLNGLVSSRLEWGMIKFILILAKF